jgi:hypothetical protein
MLLAISVVCFRLSSNYSKKIMELVQRQWQKKYRVQSAFVSLYFKIWSPPIAAQLEGGPQAAAIFVQLPNT